MQQGYHMRTWKVVVGTRTQDPAHTDRRRFLFNFCLLLTIDIINCALIFFLDIFCPAFSHETLYNDIPGSNGNRLFVLLLGDRGKGDRGLGRAN